jgi:hypothetical protein
LEEAMRGWPQLQHMRSLVQSKPSLSSSPRDDDLDELTDDEICYELAPQGITHVKRFLSKRNGQEIKLNTFLLTFSSPAIPRSLGLPYISKRWIATNYLSLQFLLQVFHFVFFFFGFDSVWICFSWLGKVVHEGCCHVALKRSLRSYRTSSVRVYHPWNSQYFRRRSSKFKYRPCWRSVVGEDKYGELLYKHYDCSILSCCLCKIPEVVMPMYLISLSMTGNREMLAQLPTSTRHIFFYSIFIIETLYMALWYPFHLIHKGSCRGSRTK